MQQLTKAREDLVKHVRIGHQYTLAGPCVVLEHALRRNVAAQPVDDQGAVDFVAGDTIVRLGTGAFPDNPQCAQ